MKFKFLLLIGFVTVAQTIWAQVNKPMPTEEEWETYFYSRKKNIEKKLYQLAIEGKLKAYKTDSLLSTYDITDLKRRGGREEVYYIEGQEPKDTVYFTQFNTDDLQDFWFCKTISSSPFEETEINTFREIGLTFFPYFGGIRANKQIFCCFSISEVKLVLEKTDYEWLELVYYYTRNENRVLFREPEYGDAYWDINLLKPAKVWYYCDSSLFKKISHSLNDCNFYIDDFLYDEKSGVPDMPIIYDQHKKKDISHIDFQLNYFHEVIVFIQTDPYDPTIGKDSVVHDPEVLHAISSLGIDPVNFMVKTFNFKTFNTDFTHSFEFSMDADLIRKRNTVPTIFWFFEDYFRWKN